MNMRELLNEFEKLNLKKVGLSAVVGSNLYNTKEEDRRLLYPLALGIDMIPGDTVDVVMNLEDPLSEEFEGAFSHVDCISVLEHSRRPWLVCKNMERMLSENGTILISAPFVWRVHAYPDDYFRFTVNGVKSMFSNVKWADQAYTHHFLDRKMQMQKARSNHNVPAFERTEVVLFGVRQ